MIPDYEYTFMFSNIYLHHPGYSGISPIHKNTSVINQAEKVRGGKTNPYRVFIPPHIVSNNRSRVRPTVAIS